MTSSWSFFTVGLLLLVAMCIKRCGCAHLGFLPTVFQTKPANLEWPEEYCIHQVPGDGGCLFYSLSTLLFFEKTNRIPKFDKAFVDQSLQLRNEAVQVLADGARLLYFNNEEAITCSELVHAAALTMNCTDETYLKDMMLPQTWGGGPEIVALSNLWERPIHVFEVAASRCGRLNKLRRLMTCGSKFTTSSSLHLLCVDGRFPDVRIDKLKTPGDHFMPLFPVKRSWFQRCVFPRSRVVDIAALLSRAPRRA